jgi:hypothetical protein
MDLGRPRGTDNRSLKGPPILHEGPGRSDKYQPGYCDSCKIPAKAAKLLTFEMRLHGKRAGEWTLCEPCWMWRNDRMYDPDPRHVEEDAA